MLKHCNIVANIHQSQCHLGELHKSWEVSLANMPFIHIYGVTIGVFRALANGWTVVIMPAFSVRGVLEKLKRHPITILHSVPILFSGLVDHLEKDVSGRSAFRSLKIAGCGSAPLPAKVFQRFLELTGVELCQGYGLTENSPVVCSNPIQGVKKPGSVGTPLPGIDVKIVDPNDGERELPLGETGELLVKGPQVMAGYYNRPEETARTLKGGYLYTGDMAYMDEDGYVYIAGRKKDMVISAGYNIYPSEIDDVLLKHPDVGDACTIGIPDEYRGEVLKSYVVLKPGSAIGEDSIVDYCKANLSKYKVPYRVEIRSSLPRDQVAKVRRETLRREYLGQHVEAQQPSEWLVF
jgi:long-chain acyl-CoA synthetase